MVDATPILVEVRYIKSTEEIDVLTKSMAIVEEGYKAEIEAAKPGVRDWDVWAAAQYGMMHNGSEMPVHCNWISGKNPVRTLTRPSMRLLEYGDLIINELEANWIGYRAQGVQPVFVGAANPGASRTDQSAARDLQPRHGPFETWGDGKGIGRTDDQNRRSAAPKSGLAANARGDLNMHGRGAGDDGPIITAHAKSPRQLGVTLQENMVFILQTVSTRRRRPIAQYLGRYHRRYRQRRQTARQTAP